MDSENVISRLRKLHRTKNKDIEMLFSSPPGGDAPNSVGATRNIADRGYFKYVFKYKKHTLSEPVVNRATGKEIIVAAVPVFRRGRLKGLVGGTILIKTVKDYLKTQETAQSAKYLILSPGGKILYYHDKKYLKKIIGKDIVDEDNNNNRGTGKLITANSGDIFELRFLGEDVIACAMPIKTSRNNLILMVERSSFMAQTNRLMLEIMIAFVVVSALIFAVIMFITNRISTPIRNTIEIFKKVARGDLTSQSSDYSPDEFGELIFVGLVNDYSHCVHKGNGTCTFSPNNHA